MKQIKVISKIRDYWKELMHSTHKKLSEGSQCIAKSMPHARNENWRRDDVNQRGHGNYETARGHGHRKSHK